MKKIILLGIALLILSGCDIGLKESRDRVTIEAFNFGYACGAAGIEKGKCLKKLTAIIK